MKVRPAVASKRIGQKTTGKTGKKKARQIYSADFETITKAPSRVWLWGMVNIDQPLTSEFEWGTDLDSFIERCSRETSVVEFFNLKFDGHFIIDYLLKNGFVHRELTGRQQTSEGEFTTLISDTSKFYTFTVHWKSGHKTEFRDAAKKFPNTTVSRLAQTFGMPISKGDIDYHAERPVGYVPTVEELDYAERDVRIVAVALRTAFDAGMKRLTVGSDALAEYKEITGAARFRDRFPLLSDIADGNIRKAYRGGFTYADPRFMGKRQGCGIVLDVNSLYPSVMYNDLLPYGMPQKVNGKPEYSERYPLSIFSVTFVAKIKPKHVPTIQIKGSSIFGATEYLETIEEPTTLWVTNVDWDLYQEQYDIEVLSYNGGYRFRGGVGLFREYIDKWSDIKAKSHGGQRELAKLQLNSLYGKFASNPNVTGKVPYLEDERVRYRTGRPETKEPVYTAMGVFITSYARALTVRAAQTNYARFAYADTDSLHLLGEWVVTYDAEGRATLHNPPTGIDVHPSRLGAWKFEYEFTEALFVRPKVYLELKPDGNYKVAFAGLPQGVASKLTFDDIEDGAVFHGKLSPKSVEGGIVLEDVPYRLKLVA